jgi:uncharacterized protein
MARSLIAPVPAWPEARASRLPGAGPSGRLHLQEGPIDIVAEAFGAEAAVAAAYGRAEAAFVPILATLVRELPRLRRDAGSVPGQAGGAIARAMEAAVDPFRPDFITPMAAVAGAVADRILAALAGPGILRAYANNGGDIALHLRPGTALTAAIACPMPAGVRTLGQVRLTAASPARGLATSGWRGRSQSLGIADAVTVVARTAALADAAATMIANAVDLPGDPAVRRRPAVEVKADSDLGHRPVTVAVAPLAAAQVAAALDAGAARAAGYAARGLIDGAALFLQGAVRVIGDLALSAPALPRDDGGIG